MRGTSARRTVEHHRGTSAGLLTERGLDATARAAFAHVHCPPRSRTPTSRRNRRKPVVPGRPLRAAFIAGHLPVTVDSVMVTVRGAVWAVPSAARTAGVNACRFTEIIFQGSGKPLLMRFVIKSVVALEGKLRRRPKRFPLVHTRTR